jgi:hypothetical protein
MGLADEADPVVSRRVREPVDGGTTKENTVLTIPTERGPVALKGFTDFIRVHGSGYFFMPGRQALRFLARVGAEEEKVVRLPQSQAAE